MNKILTAALVVLASVAVVMAAPGVPSFEANSQRVEGNVTNGQAIVLSAPLMILKGVGQDNGFTNTVTLAVPHYLDKDVLITIEASSTNLVLIADDTTNVCLGANVLLGPTDTLLLRPIESNRVVKVSTSDN